jgi:hypothetical protein
METGGGYPAIQILFMFMYALKTAHIFRAPLGNNLLFRLSFVHGRQDDGHEEVGRTV